MIDQRRLPGELRIASFETAEEVARAIREMVVRGAPAIGAAAAYGLAAEARRSPAGSAEDLRGEIRRAAELLRAARPTAVNLAWALDRLLRRAADPALAAPEAIRAALLDEAERIADEDVAANRRIGAFGAALLPDPATVIHHCNTGSLATVDYGTALGVLRAAHERGKSVRVLVDETRPRLQGARLTAWELQRLSIPHTVIPDGASGHFLRRGEVSACLVGADRIAANGDTANKIGTYNLAVVARESGVPFYVAAPFSTVDLSCRDGNEIPIEERPPEEVTRLAGTSLVPEGTPAANPAFDVTPARFITAIITDRGVVRPPFGEGLLGANAPPVI